MAHDPDDDDWRVLAGARTVPPRVEALRRIAARCAAGVLTPAQGEALDVMGARFVDEVVRTGDVHDALDDATRSPRRRWFGKASAPRTLPARPDNGGARARGPAKLISNPYAVRDVIAPFLAILADRSHATPALARWLFEAAKLWSAERGHALRGLARARVEPGILADGVESLVAFAAARPEQGRDILPDLATAWAGDPARTLLLLERIARDPAASDTLATGFPDRLSSLVVDHPGPRVWELARAAPSGARAYALALLRPVEDRDALEAVVVERALEDATEHVTVIDAAARLAIERGVASPELAAAARGCRLEGRAGTTHRVHKAMDSLRALGLSIDAALAPPPRFELTDTAAIVEGAFTLTRAIVDGELAIAGARRALTVTPHADWRTDDDELGVAIAGEAIAAYRVAPVRFAIRATGGSGSRRGVELACVHEGRAVLVIHSPFSRARSWGTDNYVLGHDPLADAWVAYRRDGDHLVVDRPLARDAVIAEDELPVVCTGEAIVWRDGEHVRLVVDGTPYHLDDWTLDPAVAAAFEARGAARAAEPEPARVTATSHMLRWRRG